MFFTREPAHEISACLVGSEMCIRARHGNYVKIPKAPANDAADVDDDAESDSGIDCSDIFCAKCGKGDADDDDDILLCDGFCECAFHMSCLDPVSYTPLTLPVISAA